ncbi:MAG: lipopolysaccharide assembly protein LapA domain-containing protein [Mycobacterium sp.]
MSDDPKDPVRDPAASTPPVSGTTPAPEDVGLTRAGALWAFLILGFLVLIVLLIFIAQNTTSTPFTFLSWHWNLPLGVAILLAAVAGGLITGMVSAARMFQLRRTAKKNLKVALNR